MQSDVCDAVFRFPQLPLFYYAFLYHYFPWRSVSLESQVWRWRPWNIHYPLSEFSCVFCAYHSSVLHALCLGAAHPLLVSLSLADMSDESQDVSGPNKSCCSIYNLQRALFKISWIVNVRLWVDDTDRMIKTQIWSFFFFFLIVVFYFLVLFFILFQFFLIKSVSYGKYFLSKLVFLQFSNNAHYFTENMFMIGAISGNKFLFSEYLLAKYALTEDAYWIEDFF